jgi:hypothetical protein
MRERPDVWLVVRESGAATPSGLSEHGHAFAVDFKYQGPSTAPPPPPTAAPDQIRHTPVAALRP